MRRVALVLLLVFAACGREAPIALPKPTRPPRDITIAPSLVAAAQRVGVDLPALVSQTAGRVESVLRGRPPRVTIEASGLVVPEVGLNGRTSPRDGSVHLYVAFDTRPGFRVTLTHWLPTSIAHELDHSKRLLDGPGFEPSLGSRMIFEGLAGAFQRELYPAAVPPWTEALTPGQELAAWTQAKPILRQYVSNEIASDWFFGTGRFPRWAGYTIGYGIVRSYLDRHPDVTVAQLTVMPWQTILQGSGYAGRRP